MDVNTMLLQGIKVVDLTHAYAGPSCTMLLADLGADVIKIEPPAGEHYREFLDGAIFLALNRNKRGMVLNLREPEAVEVVLKLATKADVFVESFSPGTADKLGVGYDKVSQVNSKIVYCSISGFGQTGPYSQRGGYDPVAQAMSGIMIATGEADRPPVRQAVSLIDQASGEYAAFAIVSSLLNRGKTGKGQRIDISLLDTAISAMTAYVTHNSFTGKIPARMGSGHVAWCPYQVFDTKDSLIFIGISTDKFWLAFCRSLSVEDLGNNPRYSTNEKRLEHRVELVSRVNEITKRYSSAELESKLTEAGIPCGPLFTVAEVPEHPQVRFRQIMQDEDYPGIGRIKLVKTPIMISGTMPQVRMRAPLLGEHTSEILAELSYSEREIQRFIEKGIVSQQRPF